MIHNLLLISRKFLSPVDLIIGPMVFLGILVFSAILTYKLPKRQKILFFTGINLKFLGGILFALIYNFYYRGGDTWLYHMDASLIADTFYSDPITGVKMILQHPDNYSGSTLAAANKSYSGYIFSKNSNLLIRLSGIAAIFTFKSYIGMAALIGSYAFFGMWLFYKTFQEKYPQLELQLGFATLLIPSIWFWAGGVMKDTLVLGAAGFLVYALNNLIIKRKRLVLSILILIINMNIALNSKAYVAYMLVPATGLWILFSYWSNIKNKTLKLLSYPIVMLFVIAMAGVGVYYMPVLIGKSIEMIIEEIQMTGAWITKVSERTGGSSYSLGTIDYSPIGMFKVSPKAIFVTLYQPFLWQASNPPMLLSALEAFFTFVFTLYVIARKGPINFIKKLLTNPDVLFCLTFALGFAFFTGISSMNFGSLVRYKLPVFPFYFTAMYIVLKGDLASKKAKKDTQQKLTE